MKIYIDTNDNCKCYASNPDGTRQEHETDFFDGKCEAYIEGYRCVAGDGEEMLSPWKPYSELAAAQQGYEEAMAAQPDTSELLAENEDMQSALNVLGVTVNG